MLEAVACATNARLHSRPNPWVGAVVVKDSAIVGRGFTSPAGGAHAEVHALSESSRRARGATLYSTLEPCSHHGRTPPCTEAIIAAGISRVVIGVVDPDPNVSGSGIAQLRAAGIEVVTGIAEDAVRHQLRAYLHQRTNSRPYVIAKMAVTQDGFTTLPNAATTATRSPDEWITGEESRQRVHMLRAESDSICVGANTVRTDDPALTVRFVEGRDPLRIVLGEVSPDAQVHPCVQWTLGIEPLLDHLGGLGMMQLLVEGGAATVSAFRRDQLIDELILHVAPKTAGVGRPVFEGVAWEVVQDWLLDSRVAVTSMGSDTEYVIPREVFG